MSSLRPVAALLAVALLIALVRLQSPRQSGRGAEGDGHGTSSSSVSGIRRRDLSGAMLEQLTSLYQPNVTVVGEFPSTKAIGSIARPGGTVWCQGRPALWFIGHQCDDERPWCQQPDGSWSMSPTTVLDHNDTLNADNPRIDRHDCALLDINRDGLVDVVCFVGADKGRGAGYNEVYLTQEDGSLHKVLNTTLHGLSKYPTMRNRYAATLRGPRESQLVFISVKGGTMREDGDYNLHAMFRNDFNVTDPDQAPWFREIQPDDAPWKVASDGIAAVAADITGNGLDDLVLCQLGEAPAVFTQDTNGTWSRLELPDLRTTALWGNVRVADVTDDGRPDLVAVNQGNYGSTLWVFQGQVEAPYFDFENPWYTAELPYAAPDLEVLDVNGDGRADLYVVQSNRTNGYCRSEPPNALWGGGVQPPLTWVPPVDDGADLLFLGRFGGGNGNGDHYLPLVMGFTKRGCGNMAVKFGTGKTMALANGNFGHAGQHMYLDWT